MKIYTPFLIFFSILSIQVSAQEGWNIWYNQNQFESKDIPIKLADKQKELTTSNNAYTNCVGLAPDGGWIIFYKRKSLTKSTSYFSWNGTHRDFMEIANAIKNDDGNIQQFAFSPLATYDKQSWVILYDNNEANWKNISPNLIQKIIQLNKANRTIKSIGLSINGGWVLLADNNEYYSELIPQELELALKDLKNKGKVMHHISFNLDNGWVLLYDKSFAVWDKIPSSLIASLERHNKNKHHIHGVNFYTIKGKL